MRTLIIVVLLFFGGQLAAQGKISKWNFSYQYDPTAYIKSKYRLLSKKDSFIVFLSVQFDAKDRRVKNLITKEIWNFDYSIRTSYESRSHIDEGDVYAIRKVVDDNEFLFELRFKKPDETSAYLFLLLYGDAKEVHILDIPLKIIDYELYRPQILIDAETGLPIFENYVNRRDSFRIYSYAEVDRHPLHYFNFKYPVANPPMAAEPVHDFEVRLRPDTTYIIGKDSVLSNLKKGLYAIGNESKRMSNFILAEHKYPKVSKVKELIEPIVYIATDEERKALKYAQKPKKKLDDFWLDLGQDKEFTRLVIKKYYNRIEQANTYFSCHKEGWKTDMGMVYIIFGKPTEVLKSDTKEIWTYAKKPGIQAIRFIFERKRNTFGTYYFELINHPEYSEPWYTAVDLWRKGSVD